ncbi:MAG: zinc-ribbon domain-containing protein, partial [bacterium]|nr:zinc-ribbon domain-containing protein [bacterium]
MRKASKENNFKLLHPLAAEEWHPTKNGDVTPDQMLPGSGIKVWWQCK